MECRDPKDGQGIALFDSVVAIDTLNEGVHFPKPNSSPLDQGVPSARDVGYKALAVNLSDLAAMGAEPVGAWAVVFFPLSSMPADSCESGFEVLDPEAWAVAFRQGFDALAKSCGVRERCVEFQPFVCRPSTGDGSFVDAVSITVNVHGRCPRGQALTRRGARPGDRIFVSGTLGDAGGGLRIASRGCAFEPASSVSTLLARFHRPTPRLALGRALRGLATAAIDISDGLGQDLGHILEASGVGAWIDMRSLPISRALERAVGEESARSLALGAGDDYELLFTLPPGREIDRSMPGLSGPDAGIVDVSVSEIGRIEARSGLRIIGGKEEILAPPSGYRHFKESEAKRSPSDAHDPSGNAFF